MPFEIIRNDITKMAVDAIVNTANPQPIIGAGTDAQIHKAAGPRLLEARQAIGAIQPGNAAITPGFDLQARYVIHTVGPLWQGGTQGEDELLRQCYDRSIALALDRGCKSIAFPLIATGNYGFPRDKALQIAVSAFTACLTAHDLQIYLVVFDRSSFRLSEKLFQGISSYIDEHYVNRITRRERLRQIRNEAAKMERCQAAHCPAAAPPVCAETMCLEEDASECLDYISAQPEDDVPNERSLEEMLRQEDAGFTETLLRLIDQTGKKDPQIYKKANISKQHFSKIRNNPDYRPSKPTAIALALALELDLEATRDLIGRAGFALTNSSKFDLIIRYFIQQKNYNVVEINLALYQFDQPLLGA